MAIVQHRVHEGDGVIAATTQHHVGERAWRRRRRNAADICDLGERYVGPVQYDAVRLCPRGSAWQQEVHRFAGRCRREAAEPEEPRRGDLACDGVRPA